MKEYKHWRTELDSDNILWVIFDRADKSVNALNSEVLDELNSIVDQIPQQAPKGVIFASGKDNGFIAGADIERFPELANINQAITFLRQGQKVFSKIEAISVPTVAMINGFCMGGGCELTLACDYRVALEDDKTKIGLPEVKLGIYPSWGGSVRLTRLVGAIKAMSIILPGSAVRASAARNIGFVDEVVPMRHLKVAAKSMILNRVKKH
ncbi:MAG: enoyl-CoA hydratase/isomerase family protein, partial [Gammaproteobacteria bacterium]|nr:enoyl-CoA hydratase/isomerase family protein [Gammaproteobacteria bacterium]